MCTMRDDLTVLYLKGIDDRDSEGMEEFARAAVAKMAPIVAGWCDKVGFSQGFAEIITCKSVSKVIDAADRFDRSKSVMGWLVTIARHELAELYRIKRRRERREISIDAMPTEVASGDDQLNERRGRVACSPVDELIRREEEEKRREQHRQVVAEILNLPAIKRDVMIGYYKGERVRDIARRVGIPPAAVSKIVFMVIRDLRRRLA